MGESAEKQRTYLPACWDDEVRMNAMFSAFRSKDVNPTGWQEKMVFWVNLITDYCRETRKISLSVSDVCSAFERNQKRPNCIEDVLSFMCEQNVVVPMEQFTQWDNGETWLGWGYSILKKPVIQSYWAVKNMLFVQKEEERFVVVDAVKAAAKSMFDKHTEWEKRGELDYVVVLDDFKNTCVTSDICKENDFGVALLQLQREKRVVVLNEYGEQYVKFRKDDVDCVNAFSNVDKAVLQLRKAADAVSFEILVLEKDIDKCVSDAKEFSKAGSKNKAMLSLKKKKRLEGELKKKLLTADNLEVLLIQLKNSGSEKVIMEAYNAGVNAMRSSLSSDLDLDKIDTVMSDLEGLIDDVSEVGTTLSKSVRSPDHELLELEDELQEILAEDIADLPEMIVNTSAEADSDEELIKELENLPLPSDSSSPPQVQSSSNSGVAKSVDSAA